MISVKLSPGTTLKMVSDTLSRIGIGNNTTKVLYPTCYAFNVGSSVYIAHFKELILIQRNPNFFMDFESSVESNKINKEDMYRRDNIAELLEQWGMITILSDGIKGKPRQNFKILKILESSTTWKIKHKFTM